MNIDKEEMIKRHRKGKKLAGLLVVIVGVALLLKQCGPQLGFWIPEWVFSWPMLLIVIGLFVGAKHQFRNPGWIIIVLIGSAFLIDRFVEGVSISQFFWPSLIILVGLFMIFGKHRGRNRRKWKNEYWKELYEQRYESATYNSEDYIDSVGIFGGIKKTILSKDFKGGEVVCVFSGAEINLSQAEIKGHVVLEIVNVFGGATLIVPANWEIRSSEMVAILGAIEDKRIQQVNAPNGVDVLIIKGTSIFGGIEIKSY
jgi:predicted membrane protein